MESEATEPNAPGLIEERDLSRYYYELMARLEATTDGIDRLTAEKAAISELLLSFTWRHWSATGDGAVLRGIAARFKEAHGPGYGKRWSETDLPNPQSLKASKVFRRDENDGEGGWRGDWPLVDGCYMPPPRTPVVYQLLQGEESVYIGSSVNLASRLAQHAKEKTFDGWRAAKCVSEAACRDLETALIDKYRPPLNRMIARPRITLAHKESS